MVKLSSFFRPAVIAPTEEDVQRMVYDLVRERVLSTLGPDGSFAITMRKGDEVDSMFSETIAETIAWDVALGVEMRAKPAARLIA